MTLTLERALVIATVFALVATMLVAQTPAQGTPGTPGTPSIIITSIPLEDQLSYAHAEKALLESQIAYLHWQSQVNVRTQAVETTKRAILAKLKLTNPQCAITPKGEGHYVVSCPKETK